MTGGEYRPTDRLLPGASTGDDLTAAVLANDPAWMRWALRAMAPTQLLAVEPRFEMVIGLDPVLRADVERIANSVVDAGLVDQLLSSGERFAALLLLGARRGGSVVIARAILDDPGQPADLVAAAASIDVGQTYRVGGIVRLLADLDDDAGGDLWPLIEDLGRTAAIEGALLGARPRTAAGVDRHVWLLGRYLQAHRWIPDIDGVLDLVEAWADGFAPPEPGSAMHGATVLVRGLSRAWSERGLGRSAAVAALAQLAIAPDSEAIGRAVFESYIVGDDPLLAQIVDLAAWTEVTISAAQADAFLIALPGAWRRLRAKGDETRALALVHLAQACVAAAEGSLDPMATGVLNEMTDGQTSAAIAGAKELVSHDRMTLAVWGHTRFPTLMEGAPSRAPAGEVFAIARSEAHEERHGPGAQLLLADLAIEFGDLETARDIVEGLAQTYPTHSSVVLSQMKLARHLGDDRRSDELIDELRRIWDADADAASEPVQVHNLRELYQTDRARRLAILRARELLASERFAPFRPDLEAIVS